MSKMRFFCIVTVFIFVLCTLFSACNRSPEAKTEASESPETTASAAILSTTETPVLYETVHLTPPDDTEIGASLCVVMKQYHWNGYGIGIKSIYDKGYALRLYALLQDAPKTGNTLPALSDSTEWVTAESGILPAKPGTLWIETQNGIYRLTDDYRSLCRVDHHLGEGVELEMSDTLRSLITSLWSFYPYNFYVGTYQDGKLIIGHRFAAKTDTDIEIKDVHVSRREGEKSTVTVELLSSADQTARISLFCQQSDDNLGTGDSAEVSLTVGKRQTVILSFDGWTDTPYDILLEAGNTRVRIYIKP